jgi:AraC family transcriptional regulator
MIDHVELVDFPGARVAVLEHDGSAEALDADAVQRFIAWRRENRLSPSVSATYNLVHEHVSEQRVRYDLCAEIKAPVAPNTYGVIEKQIPAGRCARLRHVGSDHALARPVRYLLSEWLAQSGEQRRDFPLFFQRIHFGPGVAEGEWITDIFLPLR